MKNRLARVRIQNSVPCIIKIPETMLFVIKGTTKQTKKQTQ